MWRFGAALIVLLAFQGEATAQNRGWIPWGEIGAQPPPRYGRPVPMPNRSRPAPISRSNADDDDDDNNSAFSNRRGGQLAAPRSAIQYPALLEGGPRPDISPRAPQSVAFRGYAQGAIVVDTSGRSLYYVTSTTSALRYPISVGRDGFTWKGVEKISRVQEWPDWHPPKEMRERDPRLPEKMTGGINNPLGAKALYLGNSLYRIHGTNDSKSIGYAASSGCFRMMNHHVAHLATLAGVGTTVHVLDKLPSNVAGTPAVEEEAPKPALRKPKRV
ncbi:MAG: L,D-transpeptidase [Hyphomicrobiaceae bacterium]|nr:L,D-transpeptidase [Hyphomicrobiaceae bacterium]